jgi:hypothetical protein
VLQAAGRGSGSTEDAAPALQQPRHWGQKDAAKRDPGNPAQQRLVDGHENRGLKHTGIDKFNMTGSTMLQSQLHNGDWNGEGVLTLTQHQTEHKWRWPTLTGRQQFYIDHPWFIEAARKPADAQGQPEGGRRLSRSR